MPACAGSVEAATKGGDDEMSRGVCASRGVTSTPAGGAMLLRFACERNTYIMEPIMSDAQVFMPRDYSLSPVDLIPMDDEPDEDVQWLDYCQAASTIDRTDILQTVLSDLDAEDSPLFEFIDDALENPHEPGRPKANITDLARLGQSLLHFIARAVDDATNLRMTCREVAHDYAEE